MSHPSTTISWNIQISKSQIFEIFVSYYCNESSHIAEDHNHINCLYSSRGWLENIRPDDNFILKKRSDATPSHP